MTRIVEGAVKQSTEAEKGGGGGGVEKGACRTQTHECGTYICIFACSQYSSFSAFLHLSPLSLAAPDYGA